MATAFAHTISAHAHAGCLMVDEIHTAQAVHDGRAVATVEGRLNDDDTPSTLSNALIDAVRSDCTVPCDAYDVQALAAAFDAAFSRCEAMPGDGAQGHSVAGSLIVTVSRRIG